MMRILFLNERTMVSFRNKKTTWILQKSEKRSFFTKQTNFPKDFEKNYTFYRTYNFTEQTILLNEQF